MNPEDEEGRIAAVRRYDILDTPPDGAFDRITALAARLFDVPIAIISIVDHDRIWFKSAVGVDATEIGRDPGLCASAICQIEPWLVNDAQVDVRTIDNPLVAGELGLRFYFGVPLRTSDGFNLGTLNVIDVQPREVTEEEVDTLEDLAAIVMDELELRLNARAQIPGAAAACPRGERRSRARTVAGSARASGRPPRGGTSRSGEHAGGCEGHGDRAARERRRQGPALRRRSRPRTAGLGSAAVTDLPRLRVVLADDTAAYRVMLRVILELDGRFEVVGEAANGKEAVELTGKLTPDAIVLDLAMPVMDGLQALPAIRAASPATTIVVLSGFARGQVDRVALDRGADAYLEKGEALSTVTADAARGDSRLERRVEL